MVISFVSLYLHYFSSIPVEDNVQGCAVAGGGAETAGYFIQDFVLFLKRWGNSEGSQVFVYIMKGLKVHFGIAVTSYFVFFYLLVDCTYALVSPLF